uniref:Uncharacterized protein n=1 Tax=Anguilla anguilla TaxID=7936 RepID=A0A0E9RNZ1_ANGAN
MVRVAWQRPNIKVFSTPGGSSENLQFSEGQANGFHTITPDLRNPHTVQKAAGRTNINTAKQTAPMGPIHSSLVILSDTTPSLCMGEHFP